MARLTLTLANQIGEVRRMAAEVEAFGRAHAVAHKPLSQIELVLDELVTNVISYGFPDAGEHMITVDLQRDDDRVTVEIIDQGMAYNPLLNDPPDLESGIEDRKVGGLGVHFARTLMDRLDYRREGDRNHLTIVKLC